MNFVYFFCGLLFYLYYQINQCYSKSITYLNAERPVVDWYDRRYCKKVTMLSRRYSRQDPRHYVDFYAHTLFTANNSLKLDYYFYQFLTNKYKPSFVEVHVKLCDLVNSEAFFVSFIGQELRRITGGRLCPYPAGVYDLKNLSFPYVPKGFPFTKGRIYVNVSVISGSQTQIIGIASIDIEVKVSNIRNN